MTMAKTSAASTRGAASPLRTTAKARQQAGRIYKTLVKLYPDAHCALHHKNPFQLLVSTILSAQCTDERVNMVTPALFKKYPDAAAMAKARLGDLEKMVHSTGFFRSKSKSLKGAAQAISNHHGGKVPQTMEELLKFPGVARKTGNVVLGNAFGINEGVVVDTHVKRLSRRLGMTGHQDPKKIEPDLMRLFAREKWALLSHLLIFHGRQVCHARKPLCDQCKLTDLCPKIDVKTE